MIGEPGQATPSFEPVFSAYMSLPGVNNPIQGKLSGTYVTTEKYYTYIHTPSYTQRIVVTISLIKANHRRVYQYLISNVA